MTETHPTALLSQRAFIGRDLTLLRRNTASLISMFIVPSLFLLCLWAVFGYVADKAPFPFDYLQFVLAGCLFQAAMFTAAASSMAVAHDVDAGLIERIRVLPGSGVAFLVGRAVTDLIRMAGSTAALFILALILGLDIELTTALWMILWSHTVAVVLSAATNGWILVSQEPVAAAGTIQSFEMLLLLTSTAFVPATALSGWVQGFVEHMPFSPLIELIRIGNPADLDTGAQLEAVAWLLIFGIIGSMLVIRRFSGRRDS